MYKPPPPFLYGGVALQMGFSSTTLFFTSFTILDFIKLRQMVHHIVSYIQNLLFECFYRMISFYTINVTKKGHNKSFINISF